MTKGGRNLIIMGIISILVALSTAGVSLAVYHNSGDIYLDRSRPGFLPDNDEISDDDANDRDYSFDKDTDITAETIEKYLVELNSQIEDLDVYKDAFSEDGLSNRMLGI